MNVLTAHLKARAVYRSFNSTYAFFMIIKKRHMGPLKRLNQYNVIVCGRHSGFEGLSLFQLRLFLLWHIYSLAKLRYSPGARCPRQCHRWYWLTAMLLFFCGGLRLSFCSRPPHSSSSLRQSIWNDVGRFPLFSSLPLLFSHLFHFLFCVWGFFFGAEPAASSQTETRWFCLSHAEMEI